VTDGRAPIPRSSGRTLVTGAAGFLGFQLARRLADAGRDLVLVDDLSRGEVDPELEELRSRPGVAFHELDLARQSLAPLLDGADVTEVYHLAAVNGTRRFYEMPARVLRANVLSTIQVVDAVAARLYPPRLLFASSNEAYAGALSAFGHLPLPTPEAVPLVVADPYQARWSYGASKIVGELYVIHALRAIGAPAVIVRPHNVYGPRAGREHVIPELIAKLLRRPDVLELAGAAETRSFCYVDDAVAGLIAAMGEASREVPTFHVGSTEETSIGDLAERLFEVVGWRPGEVVDAPRRPGSVLRRLPDVRRLRDRTGWRALVGLDEGLRRTYEWYARRAA